jgi:hypothetical protein
VGPKGVEPLPSRLKGGSAAVTPRPRSWSGRMRLIRVVRCIIFLSSVVRGGVEPPPTTYQIAMLPLHHWTVGKVGVEPTISCSQGTQGAVPLHPVVLYRELARMGVEPGHRREAVVLRLERAISSGPIDERAIVGAHADLKWVGRRSNPRLLVFSQALHRLSYRPLCQPTKKARCRCDTGPLKPFRTQYGRVSQAQGIRERITAVCGIASSYPSFLHARQNDNHWIIR